MNSDLGFNRFLARAALACGLALGLLGSPSIARGMDRPAANDPCTHMTATLSDAELAACGCPVKGCVRTQGYWSSKPGVVWPSPYDRHVQFFHRDLTWQEVLDRPAGGDAYLILAHQYIAAVLNRAAGASAPAAVQGIISGASAWFKSDVELGDCRAGGCPVQRAWSEVLDAYNNAAYPGAPKPCDEE